MPLAVLTLRPSVSVNVRVELVWTGFLQLVAKVLVELANKARQGQVVDGVLQTSVLAVLTVTVAALHQHDLFGDVVDLVWWNETDHITETWVRLLVGVRDTHTTTIGRC